VPDSGADHLRVHARAGMIRSRERLPEDGIGCSGSIAMPDVVDAKQDKPRAGRVEFTVLMPCLNEAETVAACVRKAVRFLVDHRISGEVLVADNGSTDGSPCLAVDAGARVVSVAEPGYGNALLGGIMAARGQYVIMGDADDSYDFTALAPFVGRLRAGADLVMGNRFEGGIKPGAMPALHRYLGNPALSFIGRLFFHIKVGDLHCGLRGFRRDRVLSLLLQTSGMEFASEMVVRATLAGQQIEEVPTTLSPDGRSRPPHLRSWRDGWRHLRFLLLFSPRWLFLIPGLALLALGLVIGAAVLPAPLTVGGITFDVSTLAVACAMVVIGFQAVLCAVFTQVHGSAEGFLPEDPKVGRLLAAWSLERGLWAGGLLACVGVVGLATAFARWHSVRFGGLNYDNSLRLVMPSVTALIGSCQVILSTFFLAVLGIRQAPRPIFADPPNSARAPAQAAQPGTSQPEQTRLTLERDFSREQSDVWERQAWVRGPG
jgi:Glycosyl transferase family 2